MFLLYFSFQFFAFFPIVFQFYNVDDFQEVLVTERHGYIYIYKYIYIERERGRERYVEIFLLYLYCMISFLIWYMIWTMIWNMKWYTTWYMIQYMLWNMRGTRTAFILHTIQHYTYKLRHVAGSKGDAVSGWQGTWIWSRHSWLAILRDNLCTP